MYDIIIVGAGTAGLTAAIYATRAGKTVLIFESEVWGGQIINASEIENYPAIKKISGFDFAMSLMDQATSFGAEIISDSVEAIRDEGKHKTVIAAQKEYKCKAVIIATGAKNRPLGIEKEKEFTGKGVSYCATCDGAFYKGKIVAVVGGGNTALEDAAFLSGYCEKVYLIHRRDSFRGESVNVQMLESKPNVEFLLNSTVKSIDGESKLESITVQNTILGDTKELNISGLFIAIGQIPDNNRFSNIVTLDNGGYIVSDESCKTKTAGIFTAGDCRTKAVRQLATAAADGAVAALSACEYII